MEPKTIDRLFQEKLKDFELKPDAAVWNKIEITLAKKKKKRRAVIWIRYAGIVAISIIGLFIYNNRSISLNIDDFEKPINNSEPTVIESIDISEKESPNFSKEIQAAKVTKSSIINNRLASKPSIQKTLNSTSRQDKNSIFQNIGLELSAQENKLYIPEVSKSIIEKTSSDFEFYSESLALKKETKSQSELKKLDLAEVLEEKKTPENNKRKAWTIAPTISQVFSNTLSSTSSIDDRLNTATKKGASSISYGFKLAYQTSKNWQIQTGVYTLELAQTTEDIALASTVNIPTISNSTAISSRYGSFPNENSPGLNNELRKDSDQQGNIDQTYGYIEVPLELKYKLLESKELEFHLIGGFSTLFLIKNNLQIESNSFSYSAGEANNLNSVNYTLNLGSNMEYHFDKKWYFDISPMVKFQTNTFNTQDNTPYYFGIYTGINYKF